MSYMTFAKNIRNRMHELDIRSAAALARLTKEQVSASASPSDESAAPAETGQTKGLER